MRLRWLLIGLAAVSLASADTLTLRNGNVVHGSYLGGNSRQVRMAVGDNIQTFDVNEISTIQFEGGQASTPAPAVAPAPAPAPAPVPQPQAAAPAPRREILRPENPPPVAATKAPAGNEIPTGTNIVVRMIDDVDSQQAQPGQTFRASLDEPLMVGDRTVAPRGADAVVKLVELKDPSKLSGGGQLTLDLASITVNGKPVDVDTQTVTQEGESRKGESAKVIGGTAALGAIIGAIAGGGKGAALGGVSGAGAGTAIQVLTKGTRIRVPSETRLTFTLQQPIKL